MTANGTKEMVDRWLPGVPGKELEPIIDAALGREISSGKFDSRRSSEKLAANTFGYFFKKPRELPPLPRCEDAGWPAKALAIEREVRLPWRGGKHPWLDALITTQSALIGVESKRYEPFGGRSRKRRGRKLSDAYWRDEWGSRMEGYQIIRDKVSNDPNLFARLDATQLFKHALALRTQVHRPGKHHGLRPILYYVYAEPPVWPNGRAVNVAEINDHRREMDLFAAEVVGDEVKFVATSYRELLGAWGASDDPQIRAHTEAVATHFRP